MQPLIVFLQTFIRDFVTRGHQTVSAPSIRFLNLTCRPFTALLQFGNHYLLIWLIIITTCFIYLVVNVASSHIFLQTFIPDLVTNGVRACDSFFFYNDNGASPAAWLIDWLIDWLTLRMRPLSGMWCVVFYTATTPPRSSCSGRKHWRWRCPRPGCTRRTDSDTTARRLFSTSVWIWLTRAWCSTELSVDIDGLVTSNIIIIIIIIIILVQRFNAVLLRDSLPATDSTDWGLYLLFLFLI